MNTNPTSESSTEEPKRNFFQFRKPSAKSREKLRQYEHLLHDLVVEMQEHHKIASWSHLD